MERLNLANKLGIPCLEVQSVNVTSTHVVFQFAKHAYTGKHFQGLFLIRLSNYTPPNTTLPIQFETIGVPGSAISLTDIGGVEVTSAVLNNNGIYAVFYDFPTKILQLISRN